MTSTNCFFRKSRTTASTLPCREPPILTRIPGPRNNQLRDPASHPAGAASPGPRRGPDPVAHRRLELLELLAGDGAVRVQRLHQLVDESGEEMELGPLGGLFFA